MGKTKIPEDALLSDAAHILFHIFYNLNPIYTVIIYKPDVGNFYHIYRLLC